MFIFRAMLKGNVLNHEPETELLKLPVLSEGMNYVL